MAVVDSIVAKYLASVVGWLTVSRPFLHLQSPRYLTASPAVLYQVRACAALHSTALHCTALHCCCDCTAAVTALLL